MTVLLDKDRVSGICCTLSTITISWALSEAQSARYWGGVVRTLMYQKAVVQAEAAGRVALDRGRETWRGKGKERESERGRG